MSSARKLRACKIPTDDAGSVVEIGVTKGRPYYRLRSGLACAKIGLESLRYALRNEAQVPTRLVDTWIRDIERAQGEETPRS